MILDGYFLGDDIIFKDGDSVRVGSGTVYYAGAIGNRLIDEVTQPDTEPWMVVVYQAVSDHDIRAMATNGIRWRHVTSRYGEILGSRYLTEGDRNVAKRAIAHYVNNGIQYFH